jgi:hypothetical protein
MQKSILINKKDFNNIENALHFYLINCNLTEKEHNNNYKQLKSKKHFFFTATERLTRSDNGLGMNNKNTYGEIIFNMTPKEAIIGGLLCPPQLVCMVGDRRYNSDEMERSINHLIKECFTELDNKVKNYGKLLVTVRGVGEIQNLLISKGFKEVSKTGNADNTFGPLTDKMVREFQTKNELTVDGIVGPNTWSKLSKNSVETKIEPVDMSQPVTTPGAPGYKAPLNLDVNRPNTQLSEIKKIVSKNLKSLIK